MREGTTGVAAPKAASSRTAKYSSIARLAKPGGRPRSPGWKRWRFASARIRLASTAKPSPPTRPSSMQRFTVVSNSRRSRSLSRKRPCRFFEKVEWSGTAPSSPSPQNHRYARFRCTSSHSRRSERMPKPIADQQHADDQFGIDRGPPRLAVEGPQLLAQTRQVYEPIHRAKQVIRWHVPLKAEAIEQRLLPHHPVAHHQPVSPPRRMLNQDFTTSSRPTFSTASAQRGH